jgi:hypothetical protein
MSIWEFFTSEDTRRNFFVDNKKKELFQIIKFGCPEGLEDFYHKGGQSTWIAKDYALTYAALSNRYDLIPTIINKLNVNIDYTVKFNNNHRLPLSISIENKSRQFALTLIAMGARPDNPDNLHNDCLNYLDNSPLYYAIKNGDSELVSLLIDAGARLDRRPHFIK